MSFNNFGDGSAPPPQGAEEQGGYGEQGGFGAPGAPQQMPMGQMDPNQQQSQFAGANQAGTPGAGGPQPGGDQKTTLW
jgi:hypothetical protein